MQIVYEGEFIVEAYAMLFNARPVAMVSTPRGFDVGRLDGNFRLHDVKSFQLRTEAMQEFGDVCRKWLYKED